MTKLRPATASRIARSWDESALIGCRICAEGLLVFGIGCCAVVYLIAPVFDFLLSKVKEKVLIGISLALAVLYGTDFVYSNMHPNMAKGAIEEEAPAAQQTAQTEK